MAKKKKGGHEHHGGAWKVAYGDFITSMMALFLVLWIVAASEETQKSIADYFRDPFSIHNRQPGIVETENTQTRQEAIQTQPHTPAIDQAFLAELAKEFFRLLNIDLKDDDRPVDISVTSEGLFITIYDGGKQPVFVRDSLEFTPWGQWVMQTVAWVVARHTDGNLKLRIDTHIPTGMIQADPAYGPWELTADMANAVRRALENYALPSDRINRVTGFGTTKPLRDRDPGDIRNQRIELQLNIE